MGGGGGGAALRFSKVLFNSSSFSVRLTCSWKTVSRRQRNLSFSYYSQSCLDTAKGAWKTPTDGKHCLLNTFSGR